MNILLGVTGSIACYKACDIVSKFNKIGHNTTVVMTKSAERFMMPLTFQTLTNNKVYTDENMFEKLTDVRVEHVSLAKAADLLLIAPATANFIAKLAGGIADDMLSTIALAYLGQNGQSGDNMKPKIIAPAMNTAMYENPLTQRNIMTLRDIGYHFIEPRSSVLACGDVGKGALADVNLIVDAACGLL